MSHYGNNALGYGIPNPIRLLITFIKINNFFSINIIVSSKYIFINKKVISNEKSIKKK